MKSRQWFVGPLGLLAFVASCESILGIEDGNLRTFCSGKPEGILLREKVLSRFLQGIAIALGALCHKM